MATDTCWSQIERKMRWAGGERPIGNDTHSSASFQNTLKFVVSRNVFISFHTLNVRLVAVLSSAPMVCVPGIPGAPTTRPSTRSAIKFYTARVKKIICRTLLLNLPTRSGASGMLYARPRESLVGYRQPLSLSPIKLKPNIHDRRGEEHLSGRADLQ